MKKLLFTALILGSVLAMYYSYLNTNYQKAKSGVENLSHQYEQVINNPNAAMDQIAVSQNR